MKFFDSEFGRLSLFIVITVVEILLGIFLLLHGRDTLKFFAVLLLMIELFSVRRIYLHLNRYLRS